MSEYKATVVERLSHLLETGKYSDTEFILNNGEKVKGHKLIYAVSSPVFEAMFYGDMAEQGSIEIQDIKPEGFKTMTEFIYSDKLELNSVGHAMSVYQAGDKYDVPNLAKLSEEFIGANVNTEDCLEVLEFSKLHEKEDIEKSCIKLLQDKTEAVLCSNKFINCKLCTLETIVKEERLNVDEVELFNRIEEWVKNHSAKDGLSLTDMCRLRNNVISNVRFLSMTAKDFISSIFHKTELLTTEEKYSLILNINVPNSTPLPDLISKCTKSRTETGENLSFTSLCKQNRVKWRKQNISKVFRNERYFSPTFCLDNNPFRIILLQNVENRNKSLGLFLQCDSNEETHGLYWSCVVDYTFKISSKHGKPDISKIAYNRTFNGTSDIFGWDCFLMWTDFLDGGYIEDDDCVIIELDIKIVEENIVEYSDMEDRVTWNDSEMEDSD